MKKVTSVVENVGKICRGLSSLTRYNEILGEFAFQPYSWRELDQIRRLSMAREQRIQLKAGKIIYWKCPKSKLILAFRRWRHKNSRRFTGKLVWTWLLQSGESLVHYGSPVITARNTVIVPVKTNTNRIRVQAHEGATGKSRWTLQTAYRPPFAVFMLGWDRRFPTIISSWAHLPRLGQTNSMRAESVESRCQFC